MAKPKASFPFEACWAQLGETFVIKAELEDGDFPQPVVPTAATITVLRSGDGALDTPISGAAMTIAGPIVSYTVPSTAFTGPERNLKALLTLTVDGAVYVLVNFFDVVRFSPRQPLRDADLATLIPGFAKLGTAGDPSNEKGLRIAWELVMGWLSTVTGYPDVAIDVSQLRTGYRWRAAWVLNDRASRQEDDAYAMKAATAKAEWESWTQSARISIDADRSGTIHPGEESRPLQVVRLGRG